MRWAPVLLLWAPVLLLSAPAAAAAVAGSHVRRELQPGAATPPPIDLVVTWIREPTEHEWPKLAARCPDAEPSRTRDSGEICMMSRTTMRPRMS